MADMIVGNKVTELMQTCKAGREAYLDAVARRDEMTACIVRAQGLLSAIHAAQTEEVAAVLLQLANPDAGMVEVVGEGPNRETVRVMAMALFAGFTPGKGEFAIFHGRVKSALYLKDAGIRKLMVQQGCQPPVISVGYPVLTDIKGGQRVWSVEGEASTAYAGKTYMVRFAGPGAVKLPAKFFKGSADTSDNIDGIIAKARRRMLLELMRVVQSAAGIIVEDSNEGDDTSIETVQVIDTPAIEQKQPDAMEGMTRRTEELMRQMTPENATHLGAWFDKFTAAKTSEELSRLWGEFKVDEKQYRLDNRIANHLTQLGGLLREVLQ